MHPRNHQLVLQENASLSVSENVQSIISGASPQFSEQQLDLLFTLTHKSWRSEGERARQQLVSFIGTIGRNTKFGRDMEKVVSLLAVALLRARCGVHVCF